MRLVNLISNFKPDLEKFARDYQPADFVLRQLDYKTEFQMATPSPLFTMDTKKNAIYLRIQQQIDIKCHRIDMVAKNFIYLSSIKRKLISSDAFTMDLCFLTRDQSPDNSNHTFEYRRLVTHVNIDSEVSLQQISATNVRNRIINVSVILSALALLTMAFIVSFLVSDWSFNWLFENNLGNFAVLVLFGPILCKHNSQFFYSFSTTDNWNIS